MKESLTIQDLHDPKKLGAIKRRRPVVEAEVLESLKRTDIERQWTVLTQLVRREIASDPQLRNTVAELVTAPLTESLPSRFVEAVFTAHSGIAERCKPFREKLIRFLDLDSVPDEQIVPDVRSAEMLQTPEDMVRSLDDIVTLLKDGRREAYEQELLQRLERAQKEGDFSVGITSTERFLVLWRYRFARDIKLLALGAEMGDDALRVEAHEDGVIRYSLSSGVELGVLSSESEVAPELLSPFQWEKRKQLKDRVYRVTVNGKAYILKEQKTPRHRDTSSNSKKYHETVHSKEEFEFA